MGKLFISYRRDDTQDITGRLFERLAARFGAANIFMDVDSIQIGIDFRQKLHDAIAESSVALVIIGRQWLTIKDAHGRRRLENSNDFVRIEVESALARGIPVVPILTQGVAMPRESDLPPSIAALAYRHSVDLRSDQHFGSDAEQLIARLAPLLNIPDMRSAAPDSTASPKRGYPLPEVPARLAALGFRGVNLDGVPVIVPPVCDVVGGEFQMGSDPVHDKQCSEDEQPQHTVSVDAFQIGRYPITVAEYACFVRDEGKTPQLYTGSGFDFGWNNQLGKLDHPVVCVTWHEATAYAAWLARHTGEPWRLPTEAEWEKAARWDPIKRHARIYPWGDAFDPSRCNAISGVSGYFRGFVSMFNVGKLTSPVGAYADRADASASGAHDMAGNAGEWTSSLYKPYPYHADDGRERIDATGERVMRGGWYLSDQVEARSARRDHSRPPDGRLWHGFRLARPASARAAHV